MAEAVVASAGRGDSLQRSSRLAFPRAAQILFWLAVALFASLAVFVLPFTFPSHTPTFSNSYPYGFNNRIAQIVAVSASVVVLLLLWRLRFGRIPPPEPQPAEHLSARSLLFASLAAILFTAGLGGRMLHANLYYSDASHILTQLARVLRDHAVLYREVEFPYGPLFFYWPATMQRAFALIGLSPGVAYLVTLASMQVLGLCMLFYILHWLPLTRSVRRLVLCLFTFATLTPLLGINYTLFRFLLPHTLFLLIARRRSLASQVLLFFAAELVALGFSPELGVALLGGAACYTLYRAFLSGPAWLLAGASPLAATAVFAVVMSRDYLSVMHRFALGAYNLILAPDYHILVLLLSAIALSPVAVAGYLQTRDPRAPLMLGFYIVSLGMFAPALARSDSLHTFFGGLGVYLLALVAVSGSTRDVAKLWTFALALAIVLSQVEDFAFYRSLVAQVVFRGPLADDGVDMGRLEALTHGQRVAAPVVIPLRVREELILLGQWQPSYFVYMGGVWDDEAERRKVDEVKQAPYILLPPEDDYRFAHDEIDMSRRLPLLHTHIPYRQRFEPWIQGAALAREIQDHWTPVGSVGDYTVYHQNGR